MYTWWTDTYIIKFSFRFCLFWTKNNSWKWAFFPPKANQVRNGSKIDSINSLKFHAFYMTIIAISVYLFLFRFIYIYTYILLFFFFSFTILTSWHIFFIVNAAIAVNVFKVKFVILF